MTSRWVVALVFACLSATACAKSSATTGVREPTAAAVASASAQAGIRRIKLREGYSVWTRQIGDGPIKILSLHGGPAMTHEYWQVVETYLPDNVTFYYYDQLGSFFSDQPDDTSLWTLERFVDEVDQVRSALGLGPDNFYLLGHSWGGLLALEYALAHQDQLRGLIVSNMTADFGRYEAYNAKLRAQLPADVLAKLESYEARGAFTDPDYEALVFDAYYKKHILRADEWPQAVNDSLAHLNKKIYVYMQGPSEFVPGGILKGWSVWDLLAQLRVPTLTIGGAHDTMNPDEMRQMAELVQRGRYLHCPNGSHMAMWDDAKTYWSGLFSFAADVQEGRF